MQKFTMATKNGRKKVFVKYCQMTADILGVKNFAKITLPSAVSKIKAFQIHDGGKTTEGKVQDESSKSLYLERFPDIYVFAFYAEIQDGRQNGRKMNFGKDCQMTALAL